MTLSPTALESAAVAALVEMDDRGLLKEVGDDLFDEIKNAVATAAITSYLAQREKEGFVMVPREATDAMYIAAYRVTRDPGYGHCHDAVGGDVYRAMIAAAEDGR